MRLLTYCLLLFIMSSCATKHLTSKVGDPNKDSFREEAFLRYTEDRLAKLENTPYKALAKCHEGETTEGLEILQKEMKKNKKNPNYWNQVGMCYFLEENYPKAEFYFEMSLDHAPRKNFAPALNNIGVLKLKQRHYEAALNFFKKANGQRNQHNVPLFNQAQVYLQFNLLDQAAPLLEDLKRKIKNAESDPDLLFSLGSVYLMKGQTKKALEYFNKIPSKFKEREDVTLVRAISLYEQRKYYEAKDVLESQNFIQYVPLKRSAKKLSELITNEIKKIEEKLEAQKG